MYRILCALVLLTLTTASRAQGMEPRTIEFYPGLGSMEISNQMDVFVDAGQSLTAEKLAGPDAKLFHPNETLFPSFGSNAGTVWMRFQIRNSSPEDADVILSLNAPVLEARLYTWDGPDRLSPPALAGRAFSTEVETFSNRTPAFPVRLKAGQSHRFLLAVKSDFIYTTKLALQSQEAFFHAERLQTYVSGVYIGIMLIMILYNLFLYISTREMAFLWYILTVVTMHVNVIGMMLSNGEFFSQKFLPFPAYFPYFMKVIGTSFLIQFSREFLQIAQSRRLDLVMKTHPFVAAFFLLGLVLFPVQTMNIFHNLYLGPTLILLIGYSGYLFGKGFRYARFYFIAWFPLLLVGLATLGFNMSGKAHLMPNMNYLLAFAASAEVLLLSMALGDKINQIKAEKEIAERSHKELLLDMNRILEQQVREQTQRIRSMLDNLKLGIFTVDHRLKMDEEFSTYLYQLASETSISSRSATHVLFEGAEVGSDVVNQVETAIRSAIGPDVFGFVANEHLMVKQFTRKRNGVIQDVELDWSPITDEEGSVSKLLVALKDVTAFNALKRQDEASKRRLQLLSQYLKAQGEELTALEEGLRETLKIAKAGPLGEPMPFVRSCYAQFHTFKAVSRKLKLSLISDSIHAAEEYLQQLMNGSQSFDEGTWATIIKAVANSLQDYHEALESFGLSSITGSSHKNRELDDLLHEIFQDRYSLASELSKPTPAVCLRIEENVTVASSVAQVLRTSLIHLLRNSLDHGLEIAEQRLASNKPPYGQILVEFIRRKDSFVLNYSDDGQGLDLARILQKASERGLVAGEGRPSDEQIASYILQPGFSTKNAATGISGRGMGLDAVVAALNSMGGSLALKLGNEAQTVGNRSVTFCLRLPLNMTLVQDHKAHEAA